MEGGKACDNSSKSRGKGEEAVDGCHGTGRGAPAYIDVRSEIVQMDLRRLTEMLEWDHMSTKHGVKFLVQNVIWPHWPEVPH